MCFFKQVKQGRTTALHTVRECATIIFDGIDALPASIWHPKTSSDARSESPVLSAMLQFPGTSAVNAPFSPIFYPNRVKDNQKLFMNMHQVKIIRAILFGKASLLCDPTTFNYSPGLNGMLWDVKSVNNASIAFSAIVLRFLLSPDTEFVPVGAKSKINYLHDFVRYRELLSSLKDTAYLRSLYMFYNQNIFGGPAGLSQSNDQSPSARSLNEESAIDAVAEAILAIQLGDTDHPSPLSSSVTSMADAPPPATQGSGEDLTQNSDSGSERVLDVPHVREGVESDDVRADTVVTGTVAEPPEPQRGGRGRGRGARVRARSRVTRSRRGQETDTLTVESEDLAS
ncbi:hypothetical protein EV361DRAFT_985228 [Lentinula raphanica]|nr:hypothetical protein EV361DRAFT_985228 [Lentinula raphanica]